MDRYIILQVDVLLKGHGNYNRIYDHEFIMVNGLNRNNQARMDVSCPNSALSLIVKNMCTLPGETNRYIAGK